MSSGCRLAKVPGITQTDHFPFSLNGGWAGTQARISNAKIKEIAWTTSSDPRLRINQYPLYVDTTWLIAVKFQCRLNSVNKYPEKAEKSRAIVSGAYLTWRKGRRLFEICIVWVENRFWGYETIDEYSMMSHRQGNAKLECNGVFRAQMCMITDSRSVK